jgi:hypothetical protein
VSPDLREPPFRRVSEAVEHRARDRELEHTVAEELEPLVRRSAVIRPRRVGEDLLEPNGGKLGDQAAELVRLGFVRPSPGVR